MARLQGFKARQKNSQGHNTGGNGPNHLVYSTSSKSSTRHLKEILLDGS